MHTVYGLIGYPLSHSFSPAFFNERFVEQQINAIYHPFPLQHITDLTALIQSQPNLKGLSVTIPYKEAIMPFLDEVDEVAKVIGAVNCIAFKDGIKKGYNTDVVGFTGSLKPLLQKQHTKALILGTGGASLAVAYALSSLGIEYIKVSRSKEKGNITYAALTPAIVKEHLLIVNTTPSGMYPDINNCPDIPYGAVGARHLLYDLVYNPEETKFLSLGKQQGAAVKNGMEMLILQAEASWKIWNPDGEVKTQK